MHQTMVKFVYGNLTIEQENAVISLWIRNGVVALEEAKKRVAQVSTLIVKDRTLIGVSTVYLSDFTAPNNPYFFFRMYIKAEERGSNSIRREVLKTNFSQLKRAFSDTAYGLVAELENKKLSKLGATSHYMQKRGWSYYGKNPIGLQVWFVRFDEPKGIFV